MIAWKPFAHAGVTYSLDHLHPSVVTFVQPAKADKPAREYRVRVVYTLHCFTRSAKGSAAIDATLAYADSREIREFDFDRYTWSLQLPAIVAALPPTKCFHTEKGNFFVVRQIDDRGQAVEYEVYFNALRSTEAGVDLELYIQSAYVRDAAHQGRPRKKPIGFFVILHNRLTNRPIVAPP